MNFKWYLVNFERFITHVFLLVISLFILFPFSVFGGEHSYQLTKIAQLEHSLLSQPKWQQLIANPSNKKQYFAISKAGQVYLIDDGEINPKAVLDMATFQHADSSSFKLTAIELHPNFSLRDQVGYHTFYTAHLENINKKSKTKRIQERSENLQLSFDAVITEWELNAVNHQKVDVNSKREVLRIGVPDNSMVIKQMSFNPYIKSWNDNFGLLYIALNGEQKWSLPLYSGVILRINPTKLGLRNFTIPNNNPNLKNSEINDAIYLLGGQGVEQFIWPGKSSEHILVSHQYNKNHLLTLTDGRNDWRNSAVKNVVYKAEDTVYKVLIYHGRQLPLLRSKLLLLRKKDQLWFIDSLAFNLSDNKEIRNEVKPQLGWQFTPQQLPINSQVLLSSDYDSEILLLEKNIGALSRLTQHALVNEEVIKDSGENNSSSKSTFDNRIFILLLILTLLGTMFYWFKRNSYSVKNIVKKQFASLELSESGQQIGLYHRHQRHTDTIINIADIVSSEIKLNEDSISVINAQVGHGFNNDLDQNLRAIFSHETVHKMVKGKIRHISLLLKDNRNNSYTVCLYMRKGSNRITKKPYVKVIDELIDWCWHIGGKLNVNNTETRKANPVALPKEKINSESEASEASLHYPTVNLRPLTSKTDNINELLAASENSLVLNDVDEGKDLKELKSEECSEVKKQVQQNNTIDTNLVHALEKLVSLKQQGFLTMEEFTKAKEKLLKGLLEK